MTYLSARSPTRRREPTRERAGGGAELAHRYAEHSRRLLKLAALLVPEITAADEVMYEAFAAMYQARDRIRGHDDVFAFLLRDVVSRARMAMEARGSQFLHVSGSPVSGSPVSGSPVPASRVPASRVPGSPVSGRSEISVLDAVRALPGSQREALVLRYYGQLSDEEAAAAMGIEPAELRAHVALGMATLRVYL
jgi:DNA-directed RNA polymerase specialized sigma24 family protein